MVGEEYVGAMVAFLTNDLAAFRARHRLVVIAGTFGRGQTPGTAATLDKSVHIDYQYAYCLSIRLEWSWKMVGSTSGCIGCA